MIRQLKFLVRKLKGHLREKASQPLRAGVDSQTICLDDLCSKIPDDISEAGKIGEIIAVLDDLNERRELYHSAIIQLKTQIERIRNHKKGLTDFIGQLHTSANVSEQEFKKLRRQIGDKEAEVEKMERIFSILYSNLQEKHSQISSIFASPEYSFLLEKYMQPQSEGT